MQPGEFSLLKIGKFACSLIIDWSTLWVGLDVVSGTLKSGNSCTIVRIQPLPALAFVFGVVEDDNDDEFDNLSGV